MTAVGTTLVLTLSLVLLFQNCAPPLTLEEETHASSDSGDSKYRLPAAFDQTINTGVTCAVSVNSNNVPINGTLTYTITSTGTVPAGFRLFAYGSKNGVADASEIVPEAYTSFVISHTNPGHLGGNYIRYFQIRDSLGRALCQTNAVAITLQGRICTLTTSSFLVKAGFGLGMTTTYGAGTTVPAGAILRFYGQNNGVDIPPAPYPVTNYGYYILPVTSADVGSEFVRRIAVHNADESLYCLTNNIRFRATQ